MPQVFEKKLQNGHFGAEDDESPIRVYATWTAPFRPFKQKSRKYYTTIAAIAVLLSLIAVLIQETFAVIAIWSIVFVTYILGHTKPDAVDYKISSQGFTMASNFYHWQDLEGFWFSDKDGYQLLNIMTKFRFPKQLISVVDPELKNQIQSSLAQFIMMYEVPPESFISRWGERVQKMFPLDTP